MPFVSYAQQQIKALLQVRQQSSASSPTLTFHPSLTPAGSSAPQEPTWDSPPTRLLETIVGTSHPRGFCLQGFPPCCKDTICASPPPSLAFSSPPHMETSKQPTRPSQQQMCCNKHCSTRSVRTQGSTWNAQLMDSIPQSQGKELQSEPWRELILWTHSLHSQVLPTTLLTTTGSHKSFLAKADLIQRCLKLFSYKPLLMEKRGAPMKLEPKMQRES